MFIRLATGCSIFIQTSVSGYCTVELRSFVTAEFKRLNLRQLHFRLPRGSEDTSSTPSHHESQGHSVLVPQR